jgi:4-hydroxy-3-methylbut-2-enyl diphosphate reductase
MCEVNTSGETVAEVTEEIAPLQSVQTVEEAPAVQEEVKAEEAPAAKEETATAAPQEPEQEVEDEEESFEAMLEESLKGLNTNERVKGIVVGFAPNEVYVDVGRKQSGYIPLAELSSDPNEKPEDVVKIGDEVELLIMKTNDVEGTIMLSKRRVDAQKGWADLEKFAESGDVLEGNVTEVVNGGIIVLFKGNRVFIPASQATANRDDSLEDLKGQTVNFRLLEASQKGRRRRIVGSIRSVLKDQRAEQKKEFWDKAAVGATYTGVVKSLTDYGAFVDLGGVFGMIHISELSWSRIKHPSEVVNVGDTVEVYIKDINNETGKISLGFKKAEDNPWTIFKNDYYIDSEVEATIVGLTTFGAFANIIPGIDGLIHISQIANERIEKPHDVLKVGQKVQAKITAIDFDKKRISLSMRALLEPVVEETTEPEPEAPTVYSTENPEAYANMGVDVNDKIDLPVAADIPIGEDSAVGEAIAVVDEVVEQPVAEEAPAEEAPKKKATRTRAKKAEEAPAEAAEEKKPTKTRAKAKKAEEAPAEDSVEEAPEAPAEG